MIGRLLRNLFRGGARARAGGEPREDAFVFLSNIGRSMRVEPATPLDSPSASSRLRVLAPIRALLAAQAPVWVVSPEDFVADPDLAGLCRPRAIVTTKFATQDLIANPERTRRVLDALARWQGRVPLLADLSDDYAAARGDGEGALARYQSDLLALCAATVPCEALRAALAPAARHGIRVIEDPWERAHPGRVRVDPGAPLRLAWFGVLNEGALEVLEPACAAILRRVPAREVALELVTNAGAGAVIGALRERLAGAHSRFTLGHTAWSREATWTALDRCDIALLPQADTAWGRVKSHNRLVETIRSGRLALASPIPSYVELQAHAWVGAELADGLEWALGHATEAAARVHVGQRAIEARFAPAVVGARWCAALGVTPGATRR